MSRFSIRSRLGALAGLAALLAGAAGATSPARSEVNPLTHMSGDFSEFDNWPGSTSTLYFDLIGSYRGEPATVSYECTGANWMADFSCTKTTPLPDRLGQSAGIGGTAFPDSVTVHKAVSVGDAVDFGNIQVPPTASDTGYSGYVFVLTGVPGITVTCASYGQKSNADWNYSTTSYGPCQAVGVDGVL